MEYEIKTTGSGTLEEIVKALRSLTKTFEDYLGSETDVQDVEGVYEDYTLCTEIYSI
jgi:hypothetical protein